MSTIDTNSVDAFDQLGLRRSAESEDNSNANELGSDDFMELMIAQLKNQDPMDPMDNAEFMSQLAQFSAVTGIQELQTSFDSLAQSMQANQALQASTLVGRTVTVPLDTGYLSEGGSIDGEVSVPAAVSNVAVGVYDTNGQLVRHINLGEQAAGEVAFSWDGLNDEGAAMPAGEYTIQAEAVIGEEPTALNTLMYAQVESVNLGAAGQGITLNLAGMGTMDFSQVRQVR